MTGFEKSKMAERELGTLRVCTGLKFALEKGRVVVDRRAKELTGVRNGTRVRFVGSWRYVVSGRGILEKGSPAETSRIPASGRVGCSVFRREPYRAVSLLVTVPYVSTGVVWTYFMFRKHDTFSRSQNFLQKISSGANVTLNLRLISRGRRRYYSIY